MIPQHDPTVNTYTTRRTRRRLTIENSHELHRNPYFSASDIYLAMQWANEHYAICPQCRRRLERRNSPEALQRQVARRLAKMEAEQW